MDEVCRGLAGEISFEESIRRQTNILECKPLKKNWRDISMKFHMDEKENYKKKIDKMKDDMNRRNREIQKEREKKKKQ